MRSSVRSLTFLYRGPLSSCNYGCDYCPFAKVASTREERRRDTASLERFVAWVDGHRDREISVLFTPWGEALIHASYQRALATLSRMPHVRRVAIQTNLSCSLGWLRDCDLSRLALWCTYHPSQADRARFLDRCRRLDSRGARYSVGIVGLRQHLDEIRAVRDALAPSIYLWVNAYKRVPDYYTALEIEAITRIDPHFSINLARHPSQGVPCRTGESVLSVDGEGTLRRCHFVPEVIGNLYAGAIDDVLRPRTCPKSTCDCYIGYIHLESLALERLYGEGLLERIPAAPVSR